MLKKYVINLKRRNDRLKKFNEECPYKDVEVIEAFDGKFVNENKRNRELFDTIVNHKECINLSNREIGCFVSHMVTWKKIIDSDDKYNLIFEDDPIFSKSFKSTLDSIDLNKYIESILFVGGRFTPDFIMDEKYSIPVTDKLVKHNLNIPWETSQQSRCLFAYIITKQLAEILYYSFDSIFKGTAVDDYIFDCLIEFELDIMNTIPLLCHSYAMSEDSDIRTINGLLY